VSEVTWQYKALHTKCGQNYLLIASFSHYFSLNEEHKRKHGRAKLAQNQRKAYRTISKLSTQIFKQKRSVEKYKKRCQRLEKINSADEISALNSSQPSSNYSASVDGSALSHSDCTD